MHVNSVNYTAKAVKQLRKLSTQENKKIRSECDKLSAMPNCINVKALTHHRYQFRLRVGNYRVFFNFDGAVQIVSIQEVKKRDENTY
jgi:mRNA interferase RelE/StbE